MIYFIWLCFSTFIQCYCYEEWISRFSIPAKITTDRGPQFQAHLYRKFADLLGVQLISTSAYNPRANGMIERFHRSLKAAIKASSGNWEEVLPLFLLGLRTVVREDLKIIFRRNADFEKLRFI